MILWNFYCYPFPVESKRQGWEERCVFIRSTIFSQLPHPSGYQCNSHPHGVRDEQPTNLFLLTSSFTLAAVPSSFGRLWYPCVHQTQMEVVGVLAYFLVLETMPLSVILVYNRAIPSSPTRPNPSRGASGRRRSSPEEEPLIGGPGMSSGGQNPFTNQTEIPRALVHRWARSKCSTYEWWRMEVMLGLNPYDNDIDGNECEEVRQFLVLRALIHH